MAAAHAWGRDWSISEIDALPVGPVEQRERPITEDDVRAGLLGRTVIQYVHRPTYVRRYEPMDTLYVRAGDGRAYFIGRYADDDTFFKEPAGSLYT